VEADAAPDCAPAAVLAVDQQPHQDLTLLVVEAVTEATPEIHAALAGLLPQLNPKLAVPDMERLRRLVADPAVTLLVALDGDEIVGTTTVIVYTTPFWIKARLDEVVVDATARGKGVGEALVKAALDVGRRRGAQVAELQSGRGPHRAAAHRLYERLGFRIRDTDVMRMEL
jgi:GNAT superfamily N-acetyltransferase